MQITENELVNFLHECKRTKSEAQVAQETRLRDVEDFTPQERIATMDAPAVEALHHRPLAYEAR
jgi:hypothetical protein